MEVPDGSAVHGLEMTELNTRWLEEVSELLGVTVGDAVGSELRRVLDARCELDDTETVLDCSWLELDAEDSEELDEPTEGDEEAAGWEA